MMRQVWEFASGHDIEAGRLRRQIMATIRRHGAPVSDFGGAELICGELLANAVRHSPGHVTIALDWRSESPTMSVVDEGRAFPISHPLPDGLAETGRGLYIISSLARKIRLDAVPSDRTTITVELPVFAAAGESV
jgi:anti-sigma regulatory factor (Ser/Thr protein kinase)